MIVSHKHKFIFVHIPKSGGSSITQALIPYVKRIGHAREIGEKGWQGEYHSFGSMHMGLSDGRCRKMGGKVNGYTIFGVVRNPWDRATSHFRCDWTGDNPSFTETCKAASTRWHKFTNPQVNWLFGHGVSANFLLRFENLAADWERLCEKIGIEYKQLPNNLMRSNSTRGDNWRELYEDDEDAIATIGKIYKEDIEKFGYTYES